MVNAVDAIPEQHTPPRTQRPVRLRRVAESECVMSDVVHSYEQTQQHIERHPPQFHVRMWRQAAICAVQMDRYETLRLLLPHVSFRDAAFRMSILLACAHHASVSLTHSVLWVNGGRPARERFTPADLGEALLAATARGEEQLLGALISAGARAMYSGDEEEHFTPIDAAVHGGRTLILRILFVWDASARCAAAIDHAAAACQRYGDRGEMLAYLAELRATMEA